jgi:hypothetical protein
MIAGVFFHADVRKASRIPKAIEVALDGIRIVGIAGLGRYQRL